MNRKYTISLKETEMNCQVLLFLKKHILILWKMVSTTNTLCAAPQNGKYYQYIVYCASKW